MYEVTVRTSFAAAHRLRGYEGECERLHGHNYRVEIVLAGERLNDIGMLVDFRDVKRLVGEVVGRLDHAYLNDVEPFTEINPTSEQLARHVCDNVAAGVPDGIVVSRVICWESDNCAATYTPE